MMSTRCRISCHTALGRITCRLCPTISEQSLVFVAHIFYSIPSDILQHVDETLKLMTVLTGDDRFEEALQQLPAEGGISMCDVLDRVERRGMAQGMTQGENKLGALISAMIKSHASNADISKASVDPAYRQEMYARFGIQ